jgi:hypothetical protein
VNDHNLLHKGRPFIMRLRHRRLNNFSVSAHALTSTRDTLTVETDEGTTMVVVMVFPVLQIRYIRIIPISCLPLIFGSL